MAGWYYCQRKLCRNQALDEACLVICIPSHDDGCDLRDDGDADDENGGNCQIKTRCWL